MNVSPVSVPAYGSAAIASPPTNDANENPAEASPAQQIIDAAKSAGGRFVDKKA